MKIVSVVVKVCCVYMLTHFSAVVCMFLTRYISLSNSHLFLIGIILMTDFLTVFIMI